MASALFLKNVRQIGGYSVENTLFKHLPYVQERKCIVAAHRSKIVTLPRDAGMWVRDLSVIVPSPKSIRKVSFEAGGQTLDVLEFGDATCSFLNDMYGRHVLTRDDGRVEIPLIVCGTTPNCAMPLGICKHHELMLLFEYDDDPAPEIEVWGTTLETQCIIGRYDMVVQQSRMSQHEQIVSKTSRLRVYLSSKPVYGCVFHFGPDHATVCPTVKRVRLTADGTVMYDGGLDGVPHGRDYIVLPIATHPLIPSEIPDAVVDLHHADRVMLEIELDEDPPMPITLHITMHEYDILASSSGMVGLRFQG